jgi:apolipoprotein N-acyltransferase
MFQIVVIAVGLILPVAISAQTGTVTVIPFAQSAPAMNVVLLGMSAVALALLAAVLLRRRSSGYASALAVLASGLFAATAYTAEFTTIITGPECTQETTENYDSSGMGGTQFLQSDCDNLIKITDVDPNCDPSEAPGEEPQEQPTPPACTTGKVLSAGDECELPLCEN